MSNRKQSDVLEKKYNKAIEDLRKALIIEGNLRNKYSVEFMNHVAYEILFGATEEEAYATINKRFTKAGTFYNIVGNSEAKATGLQLYAISLNKELKTSLKDNQERYNQVYLNSLRRLESRNEDGSIPPTAFSSSYGTTKRLQVSSSTDNTDYGTTKRLQVPSSADNKAYGRASSVTNSRKKNQSKSKRKKIHKKKSKK